jgi:hypothetical protein
VKRLALVLLIAVAIATLFVYGLRGNPPKESKLIQNFYSHRDAFERLRDMLVADQQVLAVASWGVETTNSAVAKIQPEGDFPLNRYNEYLALLKQTGGTRAFRVKKNWAGDSRHLDIYWTDQEPANRVASLDDYYQTSKPRRPYLDGSMGNGTFGRTGRLPV